ncbi:GNAT family N-acetyltransferase [Nocardia nova]|nr:GNAT family N-acetyltransferase [Nocardia nova]MBV7701573.1 GNAT family N-acetyltransferase [Nocardia nova]
MTRATVDRPWWLIPGSELLAAACGSGYTSDDELRCMAADPDSAIFLAHELAELLGICIVGVANAAVRAQMSRSLSVLRHVESVAAEEAIGWFRTIVVDPAVRGQGIGDQCVKAGLEYLRKAGCRTTYAVSWVSGTGQQSEGLLKRNGFTALGVIPNYWSEVVDYQGSCAVCGTPCRCSGLIMRRKEHPGGR